MPLGVRDWGGQQQRPSDNCNQNRNLPLPDVLMTDLPGSARFIKSGTTPVPLEAKPSRIFQTCFSVAALGV